MEQIEHGLYELNDFLIGWGASGGWVITNLDGDPIGLEPFDRLKEAEEYVLKYGYEIQGTSKYI